MNIGIIGYGKMGKAVERQAIMRGHKVTVIDLADIAGQSRKDGIVCAIDFSHAEVAEKAILECFQAGVSVVSGTTGWNDRLDKVRNASLGYDVAFCWAPNFSLGMHIAFYLNKVLAEIMNRYPEYHPSMLEIHHTQKKDSPSGTAIALAEQIISRMDRLESWEENDGSGAPEVLSINARREDDVKGIHRVTYTGPFDTISLRHHALSRDGFAAGAVIAAEKIDGLKGSHNFDDLLGFRTRV